MPEDRLALDLAREELVVLLWLLRTPTLPGLGPDPLAGLEGEVAAQALAAAERSLRARGLLVAEPDSPLRIHAVAMALVGTCVVADETLVCATTERGGEGSFRYVFSTKNLTVEHTNVEPGIHHFETIQRGKALAAHVMTALDLGASKAPAGEPIPTTAEQLQHLAGLVSAPPDAADGTPGSTDPGFGAAQALLQSISGLEKVALFAVQRRNGATRPGSASLVILQTANGCWSIVFGQDVKPVSLRLEPMGADDVRARVQAMSVWMG